MLFNTSTFNFIAAFILVVLLGMITYWNLFAWPLVWRIIYFPSSLNSKLMLGQYTLWTIHCPLEDSTEQERKSGHTWTEYTTESSIGILQQILNPTSSPKGAKVAEALLWLGYMLDNCGWIPCSSKEGIFFSSPPHPDQLWWGPPSLLSHG